MTFDMPKTGTWEQRAGWVVRHLADDLSWPLTSAAGLVGNFGVESIEFTAFQEIAPRAGRGGAGWGQWTGPRRRNFEKWAAARGLDPRSDEASYGFTVFEFRGGDSTMEPGSDHHRIAEQLRRMRSIEEATRLVHEWYERPQEVLDGTFRSGPKRLAYARRALAGAEQMGALKTDDPAGELVGGMPNAISPIDKIKAVQLVLGVTQDGAFGKRSRAALNAILAAAGQPGI